jgi:ATP-dependent DNA helicase RecQ
MSFDAASPGRILREVFGYPQFRAPQGEIIDHVARGGDALVLMPTGGGKSLCYQIPALVRPGLAVVISPLIALMQDQVAGLKEAGVRAEALNSALDWQEAQRIEQLVRDRALDLLYLAPERLLTERCLELLGAVDLSLFAIDEAHCVSQWGHDFRPEYIQLSVLARRFAGVPRVALTATADEQTRGEILERLELGAARVFISSFDRPNIRYRIAEKDNPRRQLLEFLKSEHDGEAGIVYCLSRASVDETAAWLLEQGVHALPYHAGLEARTREQHQRRFIREEGVVMVATIAFGMGIDKPDVRFVAHLDLPKSIEGYYQETGRAGRDGLAADAWLVYGLSDIVQLRRMIEQSEGAQSHRRVSSAKLDAMVGLCEAVGCRRVRLLEYFGEPAAACGNCDNCLEPPAQWDGTRAAQMLMSCIYRIGRTSGVSFGAQHLIDVLRGKATPRVRDYGHEQLSTFGIGADVDELQWRSVVRQLVMHRLLQVDYEQFNVLKLLPASRAVLKGERQLLLRRSAARVARRGRQRSGASALSGQAALIMAGTNTLLYEALREWRRLTAREHNVPAYTVFHDATLAQIARQLPRSALQLRAIAGVGEAKLARYGVALLELVRQHAPV